MKARVILKRRLLLTEPDGIYSQTTLDVPDAFCTSAICIAVAAVATVGLGAYALATKPDGSAGGNPGDPGSGGVPSPTSSGGPGGGAAGGPGGGVGRVFNAGSLFGDVESQTSATTGRGGTGGTGGSGGSDASGGVGGLGGNASVAPTVGSFISGNAPLLIIGGVAMLGYALTKLRKP
jgi:hypothetical protein